MLIVSKTVKNYLLVFYNQNYNNLLNNFHYPNIFNYIFYKIIVI